MQLKFSIQKHRPVAKLITQNKCMVRRRPISKPVRAYMQNYEIVSHGIVYFTMLYCSMNWWHYRELRKRVQGIPLEEEEYKKNDTDSKS